MKVGDEKSNMMLILTGHQQDAGIVRMHHPRCGRVVITRQEDGRWIVTECEKPDPD